MSTRIYPLLATVAVTALLGCAVRHADAQAVPVTVSRQGSGYQLQRAGKPYFVKGAGGTGSMDLLQASGGNSIRTWGVDGADGVLADAVKHGMTVTLGMWLGHKDQGFDYHDAAAVAAQRDNARAAVARYKDSPALLVWAIGNEMETGQSDDDPAVWNAIEEIAAITKKLDPNHPTMTVVAEVGGAKVRNIHRYCPDIDIVGINSYAGGPSIPVRYVKAGGTKPYILTEYGPPGTWETGKNAWGVPIEPTSTEKTAIYRNVYTKAVAGQPLCLGGYAFVWGNKQEATATWFGLLLPDGRKLGPVDALQEMWTGKSPANPSPTIGGLKIEGSNTVAQGKTLQATLDARSPSGSPLTVTYVVEGEPTSHGTGGANETVPQNFPESVEKSGPTGVTVRVPPYAGSYRLFAYVRDAHQGAAVANVPFFVSGGADMPPPTVRKASLPLVLYSGNGAAGELPFIPAGFMGNTGAIHMDPAWTDNPHGGKTCLKAEYAAKDNWGGVVWQSPANDWGTQPGGWNLTGATKLTFWARGAKGGEKVSFQFGILDRDKQFYDTATGKLDSVILTPTWTQYTIPLARKDLSRIKTGFVWTAAATGEPVTFYLDSIRYE